MPTLLDWRETQQHSHPTAGLLCVLVRRYLASSMVSGLCVTTAMNPLDVISTRLYTQGTGVTERYTGPLDCAVKTARAEGLRGVSVRGSKGRQNP